MSGRFAAALLGATLPLIMEVKPRSAHGEDLLAGRSPAECSADYAAAGAPCVSVVTGRWFGGTPGLLDEVVAATSLPVLQKDFVTRRSQVHAAADAGAAAVLLTAGLLPASALASLTACCLDRDLTPFVEVTDESELAAVSRPEECVIAVNNKDITVRERDAGDIGRSLRMLPALQAAGTPCPVSASGIGSPRVAAELLDAGFAGLLVGTSLLRAGGAAAWAGRVPPLRSSA